MDKGYIYKIICLTNNKIYIGQTKQHYISRFIQHKSHARTGQSNHKLARALRKYGDDNFIIEVIEECTFDLLDERERYWIAFYNSTDDSVGYNINIGGQDFSSYKIVENEQEIIEYYQKCHHQQKTFKHFGITEYKLRQILLRNNIPTDFSTYKNHNSQKIKIIELDLEFESQRACAKYFLENNICQTKKIECVITRINTGLQKNKKVYGFTLARV